ncbi:LamG domain-containing protein [Candidatus Poribacteria bacterium]|jgi:arabinan endo-1,5-alpha-L-arabinosidase|nr:LamG domain-containing protein [Candidatus Poribacteria bacterium]MBT5534824.1 LamG domain-containing protein [Candidatus Poribacteria bacterium]MBT5710151.1 LamG domain-containing protein [Candidatus Poribacteria bacterium]MBT7100674.1 LamG domain-containing protein [Candidatus Poribacteria bacterium]MBT7806957.1 LamG domain-containing protein [Candidatus Poribacteria bacterium]
MTHRRFVALIATFLIVSATSYGDISDGLVSAWTFDDGKADDAFGNSDGILHEGAEGIDDGMRGAGLDFDGVAAWVEVPDVDAFDVMEEAYTLSAWANVRTGKDHSGIVFKGVKIGWGANFTARIATVSPTDLTWGACAGGLEGWFRTDGVYAVNEWVHVCLTADGAEVTGYVDGELVPSGGQQNPTAVAAPYNLFKDNALEFGVGRAIGGNVGQDAFLDGSVDEIYLYNRAVTADELAELAEGERPRAVDSALGVDAGGKVATAWAALKGHR